MLNIGTKNIDTIYFIVSSYIFSRNITISDKLQVWNRLPADNVINYMHINYIIGILYNRTNFYFVHFQIYNGLNE